MKDISARCVFIIIIILLSLHVQHIYVSKYTTM